MLIKKVKLPTWLSILWISMIVTVLLGALASIPLTIFGKSNFINNPQHYVHCTVYNTGHFIRMQLACSVMH